MLFSSPLGFMPRFVNFSLSGFRTVVHFPDKLALPIQASLTPEFLLDKTKQNCSVNGNSFLCERIASVRLQKGGGSLKEGRPFNCSLSGHCSMLSRILRSPARRTCYEHSIPRPHDYSTQTK